MKNLNAFLNPKRKDNIRFVLSDAFVGDDGNPVEWEMRELRADESFELARMYDSNNLAEVILTTIVHSLVEPNLKDTELLKALSAREGRTILEPTEALKVMLTDPEYAKLTSIYLDYTKIPSFNEAIEEIKN